MTIQDELHLKSLQSKYESEARDLREKLAKKKAKLKAAESRIRARISVRERKPHARRLILIGSYIEHVTQTDPHSLDRLMKDSMNSWIGTRTGNCSICRRGGRPTKTYSTSATAYLSACPD